MTERKTPEEICIVAKGAADIYPRLGPTWERGTVAGHCIVEEAGGRMFDLEGKALSYSNENLKHKEFIATTDEEFLTGSKTCPM